MNKIILQCLLMFSFLIESNAQEFKLPLLPVRHYNPVFDLHKGYASDTVFLSLSRGTIFNLNANSRIITTIYRGGLELMGDWMLRYSSDLYTFNSSILQYYCGHCLEVPFLEYGPGRAPYHYRLKIQERTNLSHCYFAKSAPLDNIIFNGHVSFQSSNFEDVADFRNSEFDRECLFDEVRFRKLGIFDNSKFNNGASFSGVNVHSHLRFDTAFFYKTLNLDKLSLSDSGDISFFNALLPDTILIRGLGDLKKEIDFTNIAINTSRIDSTTGHYKEHIIALYRSDVSKLRLDYRYFKMALIDFNSKPLTRDQSLSLYEALLKSFRDRGQLVSVEKLDVEYQDYKASTGTFFEQVSGKISKIWWNYGYAKDRVFEWAFAFLLIFSICTMPILKFLQKSVYEFQPIKKKPGNPYKPIPRLFWYSFVYTANLFFRITLKTEQIRFDSRPLRILGTVYIVAIYLSGIICLAYMANFVLQSGS